MASAPPSSDDALASVGVSSFETTVEGYVVYHIDYARVSGRLLSAQRRYNDVAAFWDDLSGELWEEGTAYDSTNPALVTRGAARVTASWRGGGPRAPKTTQPAQMKAKNAHKWLCSQSLSRLELSEVELGLQNQIVLIDLLLQLSNLEAHIAFCIVNT